MKKLIVINYNACGQGFNDDVGIYHTTSEDLQLIVDRCLDTENIEDVDDSVLSSAVFCYRDMVADFLTYDIEGVWCFLSTDDSLFYLGEEDYYAQVTGAIMAHIDLDHPLPETLEEGGLYIS